MSECSDEFREDAVARLSKLLSILAHPTRIKILALCAVRERSTTELREALGISKPLLIAHLRQLVNAGLLESRAELDTESYVVRKYYRTRKFALTVSDDVLAKLVKGCGESS